MLDVGSCFDIFYFNFIIVYYLIFEYILHNLFFQDKHFGIPSMLVVCGDHGMKNSGSHGGASLEEVLVPLIVIGKVCSGDLAR
jgi:hypothetical protein